VTGHRGILAGGLSKQAIQRIQPLLSDRGLPRTIPAPFGELVEDAAGFDERVLATLRD